MLFRSSTSEIMLQLSNVPKAVPICKISLPGLLAGAVMALVAGLLISHYSFAWLILGVALGMLMASAAGRRGAVNVTLPKGERR